MMAGGSEGVAALKAHLSKKTYKESMLMLSDVTAFVQKCYPSLSMQLANVTAEQEPETKQWVIVGTSTYIQLDSGGPVQPARMVFNSNGMYMFQVFLQTTKEGAWRSSEAGPSSEVISLLDTLLSNSGYVVCPGIRNYIATFEDYVRFESKNLRIWKNPLHRYDSHHCLLWHRPSGASSAQQKPDSSGYHVCGSCRALFQNLKEIKKRVQLKLTSHN